MQHLKRVFAAAIAGTAVAGFAVTAIAEESVRWDVQAHFPSTLPQTGDTMHRMTEMLERLSDGNLRLSIEEPGALTPPGEILSSIERGALDAGYSAPGFWAGQEPALQVFGGLPFGPPADEFFAWFWGGEGQEIYEDLYARFNVHAIPCGVIPPEAAGWFAKRIESTKDLSGLTMRIFGLGGLVLEKFDASPQLLPVGDTLPALELGTIDAAELVTPSIDHALGLYQFADYYYFPGWHQRTTFTDLLINMDRWQELSDRQRELITTVCTDNVRHSLAIGMAAQPAALDAIRGEGIEPERLPDAVVEDLRDAWHEVVAEQREQHDSFRRTWDSLSAFLEGQEEWRSLQRLD